MFVLHPLDYDSQIKILDNAKRNSREIIIIDFDLYVRKNLLLNFEEILIRHYNNFRSYLRCGGIEGLIRKNSAKRFDTNKDYIWIWRV